MNGFTSKTFLILVTVVFPLLLLAAAVYLGSNVVVIIAILVWIGIGTFMLYLPHNKE
jgi:low affinity Fe/Cu permease